MTYKTHLIGGVLFANILLPKICEATQVYDVSSALLVGGLVYGGMSIGSIAPDIDKQGSKIGNKFKLSSLVIEYACGHRYLFHSPFLLGILTVVVLPLFLNIYGYLLALGFLVGYLSHLVLDFFNGLGIPLFYPLSKKRYHIATIRTRSIGEVLFAFTLLVGTVYYTYSYTIPQILDLI